MLYNIVYYIVIVNIFYQLILLLPLNMSQMSVTFSPYNAAPTNSDIAVPFLGGTL